MAVTTSMAWTLRLYPKCWIRCLKEHITSSNSNWASIWSSTSKSFFICSLSIPLQISGREKIWFRENELFMETIASKPCSLLLVSSRCSIMTCLKKPSDYSSSKDPHVARTSSTRIATHGESCCSNISKAWKVGWHIAWTREASADWDLIIGARRDRRYNPTSLASGWSDSTH